MSTAGSIVVDLLMRTGSFETDSKRAEKRLQDMGKSIDLWSKRITAGLAAGAAGFAAWAVHMGNLGQEIDRFSRLSNSTPEVFQRWAYGARSVGIEQEKLADILKDVQDRVGDFISTGGGPMADFFENIAPKVGVTIEQFRALSGADALGLYVQSLEKAGLSQSEMIFYLEAMASDTSLLIPLLRDGGAGMKAMGDEAERFGAVMSTDTVNAARELDRNLDRLKTMASGLSITFANQLLPTINAFIENAIAATEETDELRGAARTLAGDNGLPSWLAAVAMGLARVADVAVVSGRAIAAIHGSFKVVSADVELASKRYGLGRDETWITSRLFPDQIQENTSHLETALRERNEILEEANKLWSDLWNVPGNRYEQAMRDALTNPQSVPQLAPIGVSGGMRGMPPKSKSSSKKPDRPIVFNSIEDVLFSEGVDYTINGMLVKVDKGFSQMGEFAAEAARGIQGALGDGLYNMLKGNFDDIASSFGDMLLKMVTNAAATNLAQALFGDFDKSGQIGGIFGQLAAGLFGGAASGNLTGSSLAGASWGPSYSFDTGGFTGAGGRFEPAGIVHRGEGVLNQDEIRSLGGPAGFDRLRRALRGPGHAAGGMAGSPGLPDMSAARPPLVKFELINRGTPQRATPAAMRWDGQQWVQSVILEDLQSNGPISRQLAAMR